jgi:glyoxylase-like metal-dependent hydrolase (beta-lactamase superfamily II)
MTRPSNWAFSKGLQEVGTGCYAYLQPDGSWGWSNAGLIVDGDQSLLVDTLFDLKLTAEMLDAMKSAEPKAAADINSVVNTHHNGDHCFGNELVSSADIIASVAAAEAMAVEGPELLAGFLKAAPEMGEVGAYIEKIFGDFEFEGINQTLPTTTFEGHLKRSVGDKVVELIEVGPAHTAGDVLAYVPKDRVVYTGDILFIEGHPIMWVGPVSNWIAACDEIMAMDVEAIVPGHGPITDKKGVNELKHYLEYIRDESRKRYDAGLSAFDAAQDITLTDYSSWGDAERIAVNVATLYREFADDHNEPDVTELFANMAQLAK